MRVLRDRTGEVVGRLTVIAFGGYRLYGKQKVPLWKCRCICGNERTVLGSNLAIGHTEGCGCLHRENTAARNYKHGQGRRGEHTREYRAYRGMLARCYVSSATNYRFYGGRGVTVCDRWRASFEVFYTDMGPCPDGYSLDRVDPNGHYEPKNCRWTTLMVQSRNKRKPILDLTAQRFGTLTVVESAGTITRRNGAKHLQWKCRCDCGAVRIVSANNLRRGNTKTCGSHGKRPHRATPV